MAAYTFNDACMKLLAPSMPLFQALLLRGIMTLLLSVILTIHLKEFKLNLPRRDWIIIGFRTLSEIGATYFFLTALFNMPIANVTAILQALPLTVTLAGAIFLDEAIGWRRMVAIFVGFIGVMIIVRPGAEGFNTFSIYALVAVACITFREISTRTLSKDAPSMMVALSAAIGVIIFAGIGAIDSPWVAIDVTQIALLAGAAIFILGGNIFSVAVMRIGDIGFIAQFRYTSLLWAILIGIVIFGEWTDPVTLLGALIVVLTGIFSIYREHKLKKTTTPNTP